MTEPSPVSLLAIYAALAGGIIKATYDDIGESTDDVEVSTSDGAGTITLTEFLDGMRSAVEVARATQISTEE